MFHLQKNRHNRMPSIGLLLMFLMTAWLAGSWSNLRSVTADNDTTITLELGPATITGCDTLDVFIRVNNVEGLYGADVRLVFDPNVLEVVSMGPLSGFLNPTFFIARNTFDNTAGTTWLAFTQLNPTPPVSGSGNIARVTFRAKSEQVASPVTFSYTKLADNVGAEIPATAVGGALSAVAPAAPTVTISKLNAADARLSWTAVAGVDGYNIYRDTYAYFTPASVYATAVASPYDDAGALGDIADNYFYVVRSACLNGFESTNANRVGEFDYSLVTDPTLDKFNMIALPLDSTGSIVPFNASGLAAYVGPGVKQVVRWNSASQSHVGYVPGFSPPFADFALEIGGSYLLEVDDSVDAVVSLVGNVPPQGSVVFTFIGGSSTSCSLNAISVPLDKTSLTRASELALDINGVNQALVWNAPLRVYNGYVPGFSPPFADFAVRVGYPYLVCLNDSAPNYWP
jgi:hypothetical protein